MEPVNGGALDESRESTGPYTEGTAHRRQTQHHLQGNSKHRDRVNHTDLHKVNDKIYSQVGKSTQFIDITEASKKETHHWQPSVPPLWLPWHADRQPHSQLAGADGDATRGPGAETGCVF